MAKLTAGTRLLRSLMKAGKAQQRAADKMVKSVLKASAKAVKTAEAASKAAAKSAAKTGARPAVKRSAAAAPLPLRAEPVAPGKWLAAHHAVPAQAGLPPRRMSYWLYLPHSAPPDAPLPLLVMLHGCHQTATQFAQGTRMNWLAERKGYAVLYPQQLLSSHSQRCWKWYDKAIQEGGGDTALLAGMVARVMAQHPIDRRRVYVCGISAGAGMANILALNHPELFAAVGLHSGPVFGGGHSRIGALGVMQHGAGPRGELAIRELLARRPGFPSMPTILIQGEGDKVVRPVNQQQLMQQSLLLHGLPAHTPAKTALKAGRGSRHNAHRIQDFYVDRKLLLRVASVDALDHAWSGGDASFAFNAAAGPDASKMMLDFFGRHRRG
ncbi:PHB depolymerase family esterase [Massilia sp. BJB1822]|uniref:extracellular catalytic domain type 1 short-chain-length polyhydroxyalkanoate depolymerase n=1 Tax=Massilia sp. BJB1822 TaxID=2744470 RepID=UPI0015948A55|nr:PHB depolymerase family esterase [Massilia sp. BJB1822]NVD98396.1 PHB depolymerase family esterase [Massilia sp. BJB1822]